jgi:tetratricopeptide (TPR) repeat protein
MDLDQALRILRAAQGNPAELTLAAVDLRLAGLPPEERRNVRTALELAAIPHWFDEEVLDALLEPAMAGKAGAMAARLRDLPVVEPFPARGHGAANVHEASRRALRAELRTRSPERLLELSARAWALFAASDAPHARIEALYHRFTADAEMAAWDCGALADEWTKGGRYEPLLALGVALEELLQEGLPSGVGRGTALYRLAAIRYRHQSLELTTAQVRAALEEYPRTETDWRVGQGQDLLGDVLRDQGDLPAALAAYQAGRSIRERLVAQDPGHARWQRDLSVAQHKVGDVLRDQGDLPGALAAYRAGLVILERLVAQDPANAGWQRGLSVAQIKVGDVLHDQRDLPGALLAYRAGLVIREQLAARDTANTGWQRDLSVAQNKVGNVLRDQGDLPGALLAYRAGLVILERLVAQDPGNAGWQSRLSIAQIKVGDVLHAQGDLPGALLAHRAGLVIVERLAAQDPAHAGWQRELSISHDKVGDVLRDQGDLPGAQAAHQTGRAIRERLAAQKPVDP